MKISNTSFKHSVLKHMRLSKTGRVSYTAASHSIGTTPHDGLDIAMPMPVYAIKNLTRYNHPPPLKPQRCPYTLNSIVYLKDNQAPTPGDTSPPLDAAGKRHIQQIVGSFLNDARVVNPTILMALSAITAQQSAPTEETLARVNQFLDYMWTHPDAKIRYRASDMILNIHSDASYLSAPKTQSHAGGYFFLVSSQV